METKMENKECKNCGLLQSTVTGTSYPCVKTNKEHDFGEENKDQKTFCTHQGYNTVVSCEEAGCSKNKDKKGWEERFAEEFEASGDLEDYDVEDVKAFIRQVEQEAYERGKVDLATDIANS